MTQGAKSKPVIRDPTDLRAAAALFAIEEVDSLLDKLNDAQAGLKDEIRAHTHAAVASGFATLSQQQEKTILKAMVRLKIRASGLEPNQYSEAWLVLVGLLGLFAGCAIGIGVGVLI